MPIVQQQQQQRVNQFVYATDNANDVWTVTPNGVRTWRAFHFVYIAQFAYTLDDYEQF